MPETVQLVPLLCSKCQTAIPAGVDEVAWVCPTCGQGLLLSDEQGTQPLEVRYAGGIQPGQPGRPFWVVTGKVSLQAREIFRSNDQGGAARAFWSAPRTFYIPAFASSLDETIETGTRMLLEPPALQAGQPAAFLPVVTPPGDLKPYAEFIIMGIEAGRRDQLKNVVFDLQLGEPQLWIVA
jgi:predicted RNA-binding Zn-ribbon protein involved in translation (DUF1610 family)